MIVINCPCKIHTEVLRHHHLSAKRKPIPKILLIVSKTTVGEVIVQCGDPRCRRYNGDDHNGYYKISLTGAGSYTIELLEKQWFEAKSVPFIEFGDN